MSQRRFAVVLAIVFVIGMYAEEVRTGWIRWCIDYDRCGGSVAACLIGCPGGER